MKIILITCKNVIAIFTLKNGANCAWRNLCHGALIIQVIDVAYDITMILPYAQVKLINKE